MHPDKDVLFSNVSFSMGKGEKVALIGNNGSGKSTISSIAAGMQKATVGEMFFKGKSWEPTSMIDALQHGIGMVIQESGTNWWSNSSRKHFSGRAWTV